MMWLLADACISGLLAVDFDGLKKEKMYELQKSTVLEIPKLRKSAEHAPMCFGCGRPNRGGNLVLAHSNELSHGKGVGFKSPDYLGAILCADAGGCHDQQEGRAGNLTREGRQELHRRAHQKTMRWWWEAGIIDVT